MFILRVRSDTNSRTALPVNLNVAMMELLRNFPDGLTAEELNYEMNKKIRGSIDFKQLNCRDMNEFFYKLSNSDSFYLNEQKLFMRNFDTICDDYIIYIHLSYGI